MPAGATNLQIKNRAPFHKRRTTGARLQCATASARPIMDCLFEALFQIFAEFFLGAALELLADLIGRAITSAIATMLGVSTDARPTSRVHVGQLLLWLLAGLALGFLTLAFLPHPLIKGTLLHVLNLTVSPFLMAGALVVWGRLLARFNKHQTPLNRFACAYAFAQSYLLVRFIFTH